MDGMRTIMPLSERIAVALHDFTHARASMHIPVEQTDVDVVLHDCRDRIEELQSALSATEERAVRAERLYREETEALRKASVSIDAAITKVFGWPWPPDAQRAFAECVLVTQKLELRLKAAGELKK